MASDDSSFPDYDPESAPIICQYDILRPADFTGELIASYNGANRDPATVLPQLARSASGLNMLLEDACYAIEGETRDAAVAIQTLPHHCGGDRERISTIQPTAWILDGCGSYYDPNERRLQKNLVGHWDGRAPTLRRFLWQTITNGCFTAYHIIVLLSFVLTLLMALQAKRPYEEERPGLRVLRLVLPPIAAILFDVVAMLFVAIMETYFPERGNPRLATAVQQEITSKFLEILTDIFNAIPAAEFRAITGENKMTVEQVVGTLIIRYFYEPAVTALTAALSPKSPLYGVNNASKLTWPQLENLLTVYRFTREIGESVDLGTNHIKLEPRSVAQLRKLLLQCAQLGSPDVHIQLCRLLYNSNITLDERREKIQGNPRNLSLFHYLGSSEVDQLIADIRRELRRLRPQARRVDPVAEKRKRNLALVIDPNLSPDPLSRTGSHAPSRVPSRGSRGARPSRFD